MDTAKLIQSYDWLIEFNIHTRRSARSMAGNLTPPSRAYMRVAKSGPSAMGLNDDSSSDEETPQLPSTNSSTQPRPIPHSAVSQCIHEIVVSRFLILWKIN